ncbi:hypothetical protein [Trichothermofontia sp.]
MKILLVCSEGEPFEALGELKAFWGKYDRTWVTIASEASESQLATETVYWVNHLPGIAQMYRHYQQNLYWRIRFWLWALQLLIQERPHLILSTGSHIAVPFLILGKLLRSRTAFVESVTQVTYLSPAARLAIPFLDMLYVHWAQLKQRYPQSVLISGHTLL